MVAVRGARAAPRRDGSLTEREPLWASSLAQPPRLDAEAYFPRPAEPVQAPPPDRAVRLRGVIVGLALFNAVCLAGAIAVDRDSYLRQGVASAWEDIPMTCDTTGVGEGQRAFEVFRCRAVGGGRLPPGVYRAPDARWTSDITRRDALANTIVITPDGELVGWALY